MYVDFKNPITEAKKWGISLYFSETKKFANVMSTDNEIKFYKLCFHTVYYYLELPYLDQITAIEYIKWKWLFAPDSHKIALNFSNDNIFVALGFINGTDTFTNCTKIS